MPMLKDPSSKYAQFPTLELASRQWPSKKLSKSPRWLSTDLRDGNQSLVRPMNGMQKRKYFDMLVALGYKEIEISFPSSGKTDYDFTRDLVMDKSAIPDDVWIQVMTPCRKDLIDKTLESVRGAKNVILHLYVATSSCFQQLVLGKTHQECKELAIECTKYCRERTKDAVDLGGVRNWMFQFSPEAFSDSNLDNVVDICDAVQAVWQPSEQEKMILNLPATVEMSTPNVFADQIEYFCSKLAHREQIVVSLHPHNDRGCAVAAAELAQLAGAERVEGTLFGNGERTGNVDLVTLALNLYTQGINPGGVDFSHLQTVKEAVERFNDIAVPDRWPYAGSMVASAFSGSHQDAIKKGFDLRKRQGAGYADRWQVPYLPWDPRDFGRTYEAIIRVNSQSGKGGVSWVLQQALQIDLPRGLSIEFSKTVQEQTDTNGRELLPAEIVELFEDKYQLSGTSASSNSVEYEPILARRDSPVAIDLDDLLSRSEKPSSREFTCKIHHDGASQFSFQGSDKAPLQPVLADLRRQGIDLEVLECTLQVPTGGQWQGWTLAYMKSVLSNDMQHLWTVGMGKDDIHATLVALHSAGRIAK